MLSRDTSRAPRLHRCRVKNVLIFSLFSFLIGNYTAQNHTFRIEFETKQIAVDEQKQDRGEISFEELYQLGTYISRLRCNRSRSYF